MENINSPSQKYTAIEFEYKNVFLDSKDKFRKKQALDYNNAGELCTDDSSRIYFELFIIYII